MLKYTSSTTDSVFSVKYNFETGLYYVAISACACSTKAMRGCDRKGYIKTLIESCENLISKVGLYTVLWDDYLT